MKFQTAPGYLLAAALVMATAACAGTVDTSTPGDALPSTTVTAVATTVPAGPGVLTLPDDFDLEGHRGARGLKPENTLPAFETGLDQGVTTLELDLHFSADGEVVVWHDPVIDPLKCGLADGAPPGLPDPDSASTTEQDLAIRSLTVAELAWYREHLLAV